MNHAELGPKERRVERVQFETDRQRIVGDVTLPPEGYQSRFSDSLNRPEVTFIPLVNAELSSLMGGDVEHLPFLSSASPTFALLTRSTPSSRSGGTDLPGC